MHCRSDPVPVYRGSYRWRLSFFVFRAPSRYGGTIIAVITSYLLALVGHVTAHGRECLHPAHRRGHSSVKKLCFSTFMALFLKRRTPPFAEIYQVYQYIMVFFCKCKRLQINISDSLSRETHYKFLNFITKNCGYRLYFK